MSTQVSRHTPRKGVDFHIRMFYGAEKTDGKPSGTERVLQILLSLILISILLPLPSPAMPVNHPYRVELLLSLFLIAFLIMAARRWTPDDVFPSHKTRLVRPIFFALVAFVIWSGFSAVWAKSVGSVAHHTLLWSMFLSFCWSLPASFGRAYDS